MMLEVQEVILTKTLNLFLKAKAINFQVLEAETKKLILLPQRDPLLIIIMLVVCLILLKNMLKKKINLQ
jgi:hypothetical protein